MPLLDYINDCVDVLDAIETNVTQTALDSINTDTTALHGELRRIIEGNWVNITWIPPQTYWYLRWILVQSSSASGKGFSYIKPRKRVLDVQVNYFYLEARGFSGFEEDRHFHCNVAYRNTKDDYGRAYMTPFDYLRQKHKYSKGRPLYENPTRDMMLLAPRGIGKTLIPAAMLATHNTVTRGAVHFDEYMNGMGSTLVVSHEDKDLNSFYSHFINAWNNLEGGKTDSPFYIAYDGVLNTKSPIVFGDFVNDGKGKKIIHGFPYARFNARMTSASTSSFNGLRDNLIVIDEVGKIKKPDSVRNNVLAVAEPEGNKVGVIIYGGTAIDSNAVGMNFLSKMYHKPHLYNLVTERDAKGRDKGSLFIPIYAAIGRCYNERGVLDIEMARSIVDPEYALAEQDPSLLVGLRINKPREAEDCFLAGKEESPFDVLKAERRIKQLQDPDYTDDGYNPRKGYFTKDKHGTIHFIEDEKLVQLGWDLKKGTMGGCSVVYEPPFNTTALKDICIGSLDPYAKAKAPHSNSVGSFFIYLRESIYNTSPRVLCEITMRPNKINDFFDQVLLACEAYGCKVLYENNFDGFETYAKQTERLHLLEYKLDLASGLRKTSERGVRVGEGETKKRWLEQLINWCSREDSNGLTFYDKCPSEATLHEILNYNEEDNFDRISSLILLAFYDIFITLNEVKSSKTSQRNTDFEEQVKTVIFAGQQRKNSQVSHRNVTW